MTFDDLLSSDPFGPVCVAEGDLNAAFARADKPVQVPRTCLPADAPRTPEALAWALGHEPTAAEWGGYSYAWFRSADPGRELFDSATAALVPPAADVPLPAGGPLLAAALLGAAMMTKFRNSWRASGKSRAGTGCGAGNHPSSRCDASQPSDLHSRRAVAGEAPAHRAGLERHQAPGLPTNSTVRGRK